MTAIKEVRKELGITQEDAAKKIGISYSMYTKLENGFRGASQRTMQAVSNFYGKSVEELFFAESNH